MIQKSPIECNRVAGVSVQNTGRKLRRMGEGAPKFIGLIVMETLDFCAKACRARIAKERERFMPFGSGCALAAQFSLGGVNQA